MNTLPRRPRPTFSVVLPVCKQKVEYHPMRRHEEKMLLMAKSAAQNAKSPEEAIIEVLPAIKQVVDSCISDAARPLLKNLTVTDMEYLFIQIRIASVSDTVPINHHDLEDQIDYNLTVDLTKVDVIVPEVKPHIELGDSMVLQMRYPPASLYEDRSFLSLKDHDQLDALIIACMDKVFLGDQVTQVAEVPVAEALSFLDDLDRANFEKIVEFVDSMPRLNYSVKYKNTTGQEREIVLSTLTDFFSFV
jgi:hypothetical protein